MSRRARQPSAHTLAVLGALANGASYGFDIMDATGLPSGTVYPILARAESRGWVSSFWEDPATHRAAGRPPRKYYRLAAEGRQVLVAAIEQQRAFGRALPGEA
jgi:PadR family transcriptional regulator, regulatory protein PadR